MPRLRLFLCLLTCFHLSSPGFSAEESQDPRPDRLLATSERLERIHEGLAKEDPHFMGAYAQLRRQADIYADPDWRGEGSNWNYERSYQAQREAFLYALTGETDYAERAYQRLRTIYDDPDPDNRLADRGNSGLSRATVGLGFALAYNWCAEAWDEDQRKFVRETLEASLEMWTEYNHHNFGADRASNWVAVCRGAELIQILALGKEETERAERYEFLIKELGIHIERGFDEIGASQEGIGYTSYGGIFLFPASLAAADRGDTRLIDQIRNHRHWAKQMVHSGAFAHLPEDQGVLAGKRVFLMSGVGGPNTNDEGFISLIHPLTPEDFLPYYRWWYDRHIGHLATPTEDPNKDTRFEKNRQGQIWALLFYPAEVEPKDPNSSLPRLVTGELGRHFIRNRWQDEQDILLSFHAQTSYHQRAWFQAEVGAFSLFAYDTMFIGGPRTSRDTSHYSRFLVNGKLSRASAHGKLMDVRSFPRGNTMRVDGTKGHSELDLTHYERQLLVSFSDPEKNEGLVVTLDRATAAESQTFTWSAFMGVEKRLTDWAIQTEIRDQGPYPEFLLTGPQGGYLRGWVLSPRDAELTLEDQTLQVHTTGTSTNLVVALSLHPDHPPVLREIRHEGEESHYQIGSLAFVWNHQTNQLSIPSEP